MVMLATLTRAIRVRESSVCINTCMNYQAAYDRLISYRQEHPASGYVERHHIIMRSMGGSDDPTNLVVLTGREHWIAHLLLYKIHRNSQTVHACHMMAMRCEERGIPYVRNSRMYEKIRIACAKLSSHRMKIHQSGEGNSQYGTRWICNLELKQNKKLKKGEVLQEGWIYGTCSSNLKALNKANLKLEKIKIHNYNNQKIIDDTNELWNIFCKSGLSINTFLKNHNIGLTNRTMFKRFKTFIPEYDAYIRKIRLKGRPRILANCGEV